MATPKKWILLAGALIVIIALAFYFNLIHFNANVSSFIDNGPDVHNTNGGSRGYYINQSQAQSLVGVGTYNVTFYSIQEPPHNLFNLFEQYRVGNSRASFVINNISALWEVRYGVQTIGISGSAIYTIKPKYIYNMLTKVYLYPLSGINDYSILANNATYNGMTYTLYTATQNGISYSAISAIEGNVTVLLNTKTTSPINNTKLVSIVSQDLSGLDTISNITQTP